MRIRDILAWATILGVMATLFINAVTPNLNLKGVQVASETSSSDGSEGTSHDWTVFV